MAVLNSKEATLLIIDDDPTFLESLSCALEDDFLIHKALNGVAALKILESTDISLIIIDLQMPVMDGCNFLKKIRNKGNETPVIILTGYSSHEYAMKCADQNVQGYMVKPVDINRLIVRIRKLLTIENARLLREIFGDGYKEKIRLLSPKIRKAVNYLHKNYNKNIKRDELGSYLKVSPEHLSRQFSKECGIQLKDYINILKVHKCKEFLSYSEKKVSEIAPLIGVSDINYLSRVFKRYTGVTPLEFRKRNLKR